MATTDGIRSTNTSFAVPSPTVGGSGTTRSIVKASSVVFYYSRPLSGYKLFCVLCFTCFLFNSCVTCLIFVNFLFFCRLPKSLVFWAAVDVDESAVRQSL